MKGIRFSTHHSNKCQGRVLNVPRVLINAGQAAISLADSFLYVRKPRQGKGVSGAKDDMINIIKFASVGKRDLARQRVKAADLLLYCHVRVFERRPAKCRDRLPTNGCIDRVLRLR